MRKAEASGWGHVGPDSIKKVPMTIRRAPYGKRHAENGGLFDALEQPLRNKLLSHVPRRGDLPFLAKTALSAVPGLELGLCLEEPEVMNAAGFSGHRGRCNCVL